MLNKLRPRTIAYHLIGQPEVKNSAFLQGYIYKFFFGNRLVPTLGKYRYFAQNDIEKRFANLLPKKGFFVEIGSNDGLSFSNTKHLELFRAWQGVLVEPYLPNLEISKLHRRSTTKHVHAACVPTTYQSSYVNLIYSNLMTTMVQPSQDLPDPIAHATEGAQYLSPGDEVHEFCAPARSLAEILRENNCPPRIDFLSIDIEGHDYEILSDFDWSYDVRNVFVEATNPDTMDALLLQKGYRPVFRDTADNTFYTKGKG